MKIEKIKEKMKRLLNRIISIALPVSILTMSCGANTLVVRAAENSQVFKFKATNTNYSDNSISYSESEMIIPEGYTLVGNVRPVSVGDDAMSITFGCVKDHKYYTLLAMEQKGMSLSLHQYGKGKSGSFDYTYKGYQYFSGIPYSGTRHYDNGKDYYSYNFEVLSGSCVVVYGEDALNEYIQNGVGGTTIKPDELEKGWYLKNVQYKVTADDSPSSEAGADATYIHFSWDTDNLQEGDLLEIKTYNYYKKILGEKLSGFYDYITKSDGISAYTGSYSFSQYKATNAWFSSLENKPVAFKEFDTTDYYLRPYRQGQYGGWVHIKMGRSTPTSSPYIEDVEYGDFDDDNNWTVDEDLTDKNGGHHGIDQGGSYIPPDQTENPFTGTNIAGIFQYFYDFMKQIPAMIGDLPALVGNIISFLPNPIIAFIGIGVIVAIILRIVGR